LIGVPECKDKAMVELPLELCDIKMQGFSCKLVNGVSLLPSFMHRLEARLLAAQLRCMLSQSYPAATRLSIDRVRICFAQSLINLVQALMCFNQSGAGIRNCTRPLLGMKVDNQVIKKTNTLFIYISMVLNSFEKFKENCWVFAGSFMISGGSLILFLQIPRTGSYFKNERPEHTGFNVFCSSAVQQLDPIVVTILCCLSSSLQDPGLGFRV
jgi:hypothetical protein